MSLTLGLLVEAWPVTAVLLGGGPQPADSLGRTHRSRNVTDRAVKEKPQEGPQEDTQAGWGQRRL